MTKLVSLRVTIPVGDDVTTDYLTQRVRSTLEACGPLERDRDDQKDLRVHWPAVDVVRVVDRAAVAPDKRMTRTKLAAVGQGNLA